ncbi:putative baseplate assembly protein [Sulfurirhabdus autotrophica]|nr:putative baseplate assembly protein [Sulfurirhabdus autotrophica]
MLSKLRYRVGTHGSFFETMQARLSGQEYSELAALKTREKNDASIALLDAWSMVGDVLTFYQERIANEGYLRTATERRSVLELARLVGYALRPGVASSVYLAYSMARDSDPVTIPKGARANSIPVGADEQMQAFETIEPILARWEWNVLKPRLERPQLFLGKDTQSLNDVYLAGIATGLKPNDRLLLVMDAVAAAIAPFRVLEVNPMPAANPITGKDRTRVSIVPLMPTQIFALESGQILARTKNIATEFSNLEKFKVTADSEMARYVQALMSEMIDAIKAGSSGQQLLAEMHKNFLPRLREQQKIAKEGGYNRLEPWISAFIMELESKVVPFARAKAMAVPSAASTGTSDTLGNIVLPGTQLGSMLVDLGKAPSLPPPNATNLARNVSRSFAPSSDTLPRLIASLVPSAASTLYAAWNNVAVAPVDPSEVYALRLKVAPFGYNAPLKAIVDEDGRVIGQEEWPLDGSVATSIQFIRVSNTLHVSGQRGSERYTWLLQLKGNDFKQTIQWAQFTEVVVSAKFVDLGNTVFISMSVEFTALTTHNTAIELSTDQLALTVGNNKFDMQRDQRIQEDTDTDRLSIDWITSRRLDSDVVTVNAASLQPPPLNVVPLDTAYEQIIPGSWVLIERADQNTSLVTRVIQVQTIAKADYGLTGKSTLLTLQDNWLTANDVLLSVFRATAVHVLSEGLALADEPISDPICGVEIELDGLYDGLDAGRWLIIAGERSDILDANGEVVPGVQAVERVMLSAVRQDVSQSRSFDGDISIPRPGDTTHTFIQLSAQIAYCYKRDTVRIYGNVAKATHGETRQETLGAGDATLSLQQFTLKQSPLTYTSAATTSGIASTLQVRVNDVEWHEVDSLAAIGPNDRNFITSTDDAGKTTVVFGNGVHGSRLPSGQESIKAVFRNGIGKPGNVKAGQIALLNTRPLGVIEVNNPIRSSGGADKEPRDQARKNIPLALMALDRLVSTPDYADFSRTFGGVGKATSARLTNGRQERVHVTIAGVDDIPIDETSDLYRNLFDALHRFGDQYLPITLAVRERLALVISANIRVHPDYQWETLEPKVRGALIDAFSFNNVDLGQDLLLADAIKTIQAVPGVVYVDVDVFDTISEATILAGFTIPTASGLTLKDRIFIEVARFDQGVLLPAQVAYLSPEVPDTLILQEIKQ